MKPCLKKSVTAYIITTTGSIFKGRNDISNISITSCPREDIGAKFGERYDLCQNECQQTGHAEIMAILAAKDAQIAGSKVYLHGIDRICDPCRDALVEKGIYTIILDISDQQQEAIECLMTNTTTL